MVVDRPLVRLQCYEGLDESKALYEWKYGKQLLYTQLLKEQLGDVLDGARGVGRHEAEVNAVEPRPRAWGVARLGREGLELHAR